MFTPEEDKGLSPSLVTPEGGVRILLVMAVGYTGTGRGACEKAERVGEEVEEMEEGKNELLGAGANEDEAEAGAGYLCVLGISGGGREKAGSPPAAGRRDAKLVEASILPRRLPELLQPLFCVKWIRIQVGSTVYRVCLGDPTKLAERSERSWMKILGTEPCWLKVNQAVS